MDPRTRMIVEIDAIHELLGELDYYRVLQLQPDAEQAAVGTAFRQESRRLHPDRLAALRDQLTEEQVAQADAPETKVGWAFGGQFADFDNDGWLDLYVPSGLYTAPKSAATEVDL